MKRVAAIDVGTNTILMLIAERTASSAFIVLRDEHSIGRLGKGVDEQKNIQPETLERVLGILRSYKNIAQEYAVDSIVAYATSALRDAVNRQSVLEVIHKELGIDLRVISGIQEAELTYKGALVGWAKERDVSYAVLDIGGGSTELSYGRGWHLKTSQSLNIGAVRITERILRTSPPSAAALAEAQHYIREQIRHYPLLPSRTQLVAVAGTPTTLAAYVQQLSAFDATKIHRFQLHRNDVAKAYDELHTLTLEELHRIPSIHPQRADILLAGIIILLEVLNYYNLESVLVSSQGLRYGMAHSALFNDGN